MAVEKIRNGVVIGTVVRDFQIRCTTDVTAGIGQSKQNKQTILLYPNPVNDKLYIDNLNSSVKNKVFIFDLTGRLIKEIMISETHAELSLSGLYKGLYNYVVSSNKLVVTRGKFAKD